MRKYITKSKIKLFILAFAFVGIITIAGNVSLVLNRNVIDQEIDGFFLHDITVGSCFYIFPNYIILNNIAFTISDPLDDDASFTLSRITARFAFWKFLTEGNFHVFDATLHPSKVNYYVFSQFFEDNFAKIVEAIKNSPGDNMFVRVKETLLDFSQKGKPDYVAAELYLSLKGDVLEARGLFRTDQYEFSIPDSHQAVRTDKGWPLLYKLKGQILPDGLLIDHVISKGANHYSKLWGNLHSGKLKVNGFTFMDTAKQGITPEKYSNARFFREFSTDSELSNIDVYILDIDGTMDFVYPHINVERLAFAMNNVPVTLKGKVSLLNPVTMDTEISIRHPVSVSPKDALFKKAHVRLNSQWVDNVLDTNGVVDINFYDKSDLSFSPGAAQLTFENLTYRLDSSRRSTLNLAKGDIAYWINDNAHIISMEDFTATANTQMGGLKVVTFDAPFYDGLLNGKLWYDSTQIPARITSQIELNNVDTDAMEEFVVHFAKFNGRMSSQMNFTNTPQLDLSGDIIISDGQMTNFNFFNWVGDSFRLPTLKAIDFERATAQFSINKELMELYDIRLKTHDVRISGYFNVDNKNLVTSKLSIALSKDLLSDSSKFKPILIMFEDDHANLDFNFRLSGNLDSMNFQWMPSLVKNKIQTRIPDFIERRIERNIDEMMEVDPEDKK